MTGAELRAHRLQHRLTQQQLAGDLGVRANTVARWERGERQIPATVARMISLHEDRAQIIRDLRAALQALHEDRARIIRDLRAALRARDDMIRTLRENIRRLKQRRRSWDAIDLLLRTASVAEPADRVYRRLALKYHPDRHPEQAAVMRDINELWQAMRRRL